VRQVVAALLSNAIKFSEFGAHITITVVHRLREATLRVTDEGKGIDPEFLPHVFDLFSQEDASLTRTQGGLGLGLAISRRIVELHDGTLEARSEGLGKGAEFTVKLPTENYTPPREFDEVLLDPALRPSEKLSGLRIMVVDDDPDCLDILGSWLTSQGAEIQAFSEARDAYLQVVGLQPHVVLSDLSMPHVDGITFIEKLVSTRHYGEHSIVIAAVTAFGDEHKRREALSKGFNGYFVKPYRFCELLDWLIKVKLDLDHAGHLSKSASAGQVPTRDSNTDTMHL
jgi:CheY-like chemotaxis protein